MTEVSTPTPSHARGATLPDDGQTATKELHEKSPAGHDDGVGELLAELCDETLTEAERLENQFALSNRWTIDGGRLESRILRVLKHDPRTPESETRVPDTSIANASLSQDAHDLLAHLPATQSELTTHLDKDTQTVRNLISSIRDKGITIQKDTTTGKYQYDPGSDDDGETPPAMGFGSLTPGTDSTENESESESIYLVYWLPTEDVAVEEFEKPIPWSADEYKFARLVEAIGYGPGTIDQIEGEAVVLNRDGNDWAVPDPADHDIHPAAYTTTPVAPPGTSTRSTLAHVRRAVAPKARRVVLNRYTAGAAAFLLGAAVTYVVYLIGAAIIGFLLSFPEKLTASMTAQPDSTGSSDGMSQATAEQMVQLMQTMISYMIPLMILPIILRAMKGLMSPGDRY